ncbi:MAG: crossover junction endodeoxyribonuclease RuvC [Planctomycetota bacterium]
MERKNDRERILGIDPGLNITGYGVVSMSERRMNSLHLIEAGVVRMTPKAPMPQRLHELFRDLREIIEEHQPERIALEQLYSHYERPRTAILMGHARGVICLAAEMSGIPVDSFEPTRIKKMLTGSGRATKEQMQDAVQMQLSLKDRPEPADVADAIAAAICGLARVA